jgi:hypothetical protein
LVVGFFEEFVGVFEVDGFKGVEFCEEFCGECDFLVGLVLGGEG